MVDSNKELLNDIKVNAWIEQEKITMHFNELILKIRIQALGALAAVITVGGAIIRFQCTPIQIPWELVMEFSLVLIAFWIAIWVLDFKYYNRLLLGAVDSLLELENQINNGKPIQIDMSHRIEAAVVGKPINVSKTYTGPTIFYSIVLVVLLSGFLYSLTMVLYSHGIIK